MIIEGIGKYKVLNLQTNLSITKLIPVKLGTPLSEDDFIVCNSCLVAICSSHILIFRAVEANLTKPKIFSLDSKKWEKEKNLSHTDYFDGKSKQKNQKNYIRKSDSITHPIIDGIIDSKNHSEFPYEINSFDSLYHCTNLKVDNETFIFEFDISQHTKADVLNEIEKIKGKLYCENGVYSIGSLYISNYSQSRNVEYLVKCCDFNFKVSFDVLLADHSKCNSTVLESKAKKSVKGKKSKKTYLSMALPSSKRFIFSKYNSREYSSENAYFSKLKIESVIFENFNDSGYSKLCKAYLKECKSTKYNYIKNGILKNTETFYFTILKVSDTAVVLVSRKLFDFTQIFNLINDTNDITLDLLKIPDLNNDDFLNSNINHNKGDLVSDLLKIPDLNTDDYSGHLEISYRNFKNIITRYTVPECDYSELFNLTNECLKIQINSDDKNSNSFFNNPFWFIRAFEEAIYPLRFPGLIACPLLDEMEYLLQGPYPSIFSSKKQFKDCAQITVSFSNTVNNSTHEQVNKINKNPWVKYIKQIVNDQDLKFHFLESEVNKIDKNPWVKYIKQIVNDQNLKFHFLESDPNFYCSKTFYLSLLLSARKQIVRNLPFSSRSSNILEKCFLNQKIVKNTNYRYNLNSFRLSFFNYSRLNSRDSLTVWMMIYPDTLNLKKLLFTRNVDLSILAKRACFQKEYELLDLIVKRATPLKKQKTKNKVSTIRFLFFKKQTLKPKKSSNYLFSIFENFESDPTLLVAPISSDLDVKLLKHPSLKYSTLFEVNGHVHELMRPKDIFLCLAKNLFLEQVLGSIVVYLKYENLPFPDERVTENTEKQSDFSIFMNLEEFKLLSLK